METYDSPSNVMALMLAERTLRRFNLAEYEAMIRHGILTAGDRVELIAGEIVEMPPIGNAHKSAEVLLASFFFRALPQNDATIMVQQAVAIVPHSMPEPDLMLLRYRADAYAGRDNHPDDVLLVVEVAESSLHFDRTTKMRLYSQAGIPEYWIVDVKAKAVEMYREPKDDAYTVVRVARGRDVATPLAFPGASFCVATIFVGSR